MIDSNNALTLLIDFTVIAVLIVGIWQFRAPRGARFGTGQLHLHCCALLAWFYTAMELSIPVLSLLSLLVGSIAGYAVARTVSMIQIPAMVAFQHGAGGIAAFLVSLVELMRGAHDLGLINEVSGILGLTIGALTFQRQYACSR